MSEQEIQELFPTIATLSLQGLLKPEQQRFVELLVTHVPWAEEMYMESLTRLQERRVTMFRVGVLFIALGLLFLVALTVLLAIELSPNPFIG